MFEVMVDGVCAYRGHDERGAYDYYEFYLDGSRHRDSFPAYSRVALYLNGRCVRQVGTLEDEVYNLPHSD